METEKLYSAAEAGKVLGISHAMMRLHLQAGLIRARKLVGTGAWVITQSDLDAFRPPVRHRDRGTIRGRGLTIAELQKRFRRAPEKPQDANLPAGG